jgi:hypothetical protein
MLSIFKVLSSQAWEEATITGIIPRVNDDCDDLGIAVYKYTDLANVCQELYEKSDYPVALEFAEGSYSEQLDWTEVDNAGGYPVGRINVESLLADLVLNIYSFEVTQTDKGVEYKISGE